MSQQVISKRTGLILTSVGAISTVISVPVNAQTTTEQSSIADVIAILKYPAIIGFAIRMYHSL